MENSKKVIAWFEEIGRADIPIAGGKGANLGELIRARVPVPPGFVVTADAYFRFIRENDLVDRIQHHLRYLDPRDHASLRDVAFEIKQIISLAPMAAPMAAEIREAYR